MREQLEQLRRATAAGDVGLVVFYGASRLSRNEPELLEVLEEFDAHGVAVQFVKDQRDIRSWAMNGLRHAASILLEFALSLVGQKTRTP